MTGTKQIPTSYVCSTDESKLKEFLVNETLSQICYTEKDKSKGIIVNECSTDKDKSECVHKNVNKQKDAEYEEYSVTDELPIYFNIFKCDRSILNRLDVTYEQACIATTKDKYFEKMLETLVNHNDRHNAPFSNEKLQQAVS